MTTYQSDILIIGGGAAGLMAAIGAASPDEGPVVTVLEKMPRPARKIMITGKGRCNFTNLKNWNEFESHVHPKPNLLKSAFYNLTPENMISFLESEGLETVVERGDRAFPASHLAHDVVDTLVAAAGKAGAHIFCGCETASVEKSAAENDGYVWKARLADGRIWEAKRLIIATGGLSYPKTGSTGDGYRWAAGLGHSTTPLFPSLTAITPKDYRYEETIQLKNVNATLFIDGNEAQSEFGDLDFTNGGIEGPVGFKLSRKAVKAIINGSKVKVVIDLKPAVEAGELDTRIHKLWNEISSDKRSQGKPYRTKMNVLLSKLLPSGLIRMFLGSNSGIGQKDLAQALKNWEIEITGNVGYERCVITAGGVKAEEVSARTMESKLNPGLYFAGEILDLDADTGGYNLQIAFSTGYLAGQSAKKSLNF